MKKPTRLRYYLYCASVLWWNLTHLYMGINKKTPSFFTFRLAHHVRRQQIMWLRTQNSITKDVKRKPMFRYDIPAFEGGLNPVEFYETTGKSSFNNIN